MLFDMFIDVPMFFYRIPLLISMYVLLTFWAWVVPQILIPRRMARIVFSPLNIIKRITAKKGNTPIKY